MFVNQVLGRSVCLFPARLYFPLTSKTVKKTICGSCRTIVLMMTMMMICKTSASENMCKKCMFSFRKGSSWAQLPALRRKCDSGDDSPPQPVSEQQASELSREMKRLRVREENQQLQGQRSESCKSSRVS